MYPPPPLWSVCAETAYRSFTFCLYLTSELYIRNKLYTPMPLFCLIASPFIPCVIYDMTGIVHLKNI